MKRPQPWFLAIRLLIAMILLTSLLALSAPITPPASWFAFQMPWDDGTASFFYDPAGLDAPAGKYGYVQVSPEGHFTVGGQRIRFWGTVMVGNGAFPSSPDVAEQIASRLAKLGFNLVIFHAIDQLLLGSTCDGPLNATKLSQLNDFITALKAAGIYVGLPLFEKREYTNCADIESWDQLTEYQRRLISLFDPDAIALQKSYAKQLLYDTGYVNEPAVALVKVINEVSLFVAWQSGGLNPRPNNPLPDYYLNELDEFFNEWLRANYADRTELANAWSQDPWGACSRKGLESDEDPWDGSGTVRRVTYPTGSPPEYCWNRYLDTARFYRDLEQRYFKTMHDYLKNPYPDGLGLQVPVSAVHNFYGMANKIALYDEFDYMSQNIEWEHPWNPAPPSGASVSSQSLAYSDSYLYPEVYAEEAGVRAQYVYLPIDFLNTPMVYAENGTSSAPPGPWDRAWIEKKNTIYKAAFASAFSGKPYILNEYNHHFPNEYQAEFPLVISSYARFQDWDGVVIHSYISSADTSYLASYVVKSFFDIYNNPVLMAQMPVASRIFREGYVSEATSTVTVPYTVNYPESCPPPANGCSITDIEDEGLSGYFDCQTDPHCWPADANLGNSVDMHAPLVHKVRNDVTTASSSPSWSGGSSPYTSDTGELNWDIDNGVVLIDAAKVQAAIGFLSKQPIVLPHLEINAATDFAAISLIPLDNNPIAVSKKLLLTTAGRVTTPNMDIDPVEAADGFYGCAPCTLNAWGTDPSVVQPVEAQITLNLPGVVGIHVYRLDETGNRGAEIPVQNLGNGRFTFSVGTQQTLWYGIEVESTNTTAVFRVTRSGNVLADRAFNCGRANQCFNSGSGADVAEYIETSEPVEPGDVVEFDPTHPGRYRKSRTAYSELVAGVISSSPGVTMGEFGPRRHLLALMGVVPVKASAENGPIRPGDLLTSASTPGYAMRCAAPQECAGAIIGKALEPLDNGKGMIKMLVMR